MQICLNEVIFSIKSSSIEISNLLFGTSTSKTSPFLFTVNPNLSNTEIISFSSISNPKIELIFLAVMLIFLEDKSSLSTFLTCSLVKSKDSTLSKLSINVAIRNTTSDLIKIS